METIKKIEIHSVKEVILRDENNKITKKFNAYKAVKNDGKLIDIKFVQGCDNIPVEPCYIEVLDTNWNLASNQKYPCIWVKNVERIIPFENKGNPDIF